MSLDRKGIASTSLVNGSNDKEAIESSTSAEMTRIFRQFNMKFNDLSFYSYMYNMTSLMKKHFHKEDVFQIEEIRAEEAFNTLFAVETFMRSLHFRLKRCPTNAFHAFHVSATAFQGGGGI